MPKTVNRNDIARIIASQSKFTIKDVDHLLDLEDYVMSELLSQGISIKRHKFYKLNVETKPPKRAWDGIKKEYYNIPEKKVVKMQHLSLFEKTLERLNTEG
jgi:nucleoid DNA-binding protein